MLPRAREVAARLAAIPPTIPCACGCGTLMRNGQVLGSHVNSGLLWRPKRRVPCSCTEIKMCTNCRAYLKRKRKREGRPYFLPCPGCDRKYVITADHGMCRNCWEKESRKGLPKGLSSVEYFWQYISVEGGHWWWQGRVDGRGVPNNARLNPRRFSYQHYVERFGEDSRKLLVLVTCGNPRCVNPEHLEAVTRSEEYLRHPKMVCKHGHVMEGANLRVVGNRRRCVACVRLHNKEKKRRLKQRRANA